MKSVGIDIGTSSIKVTEVTAGTRDVIVSSFREFSIGDNPAHDPEIEIIDTLKRIASDYDATKTRFVLGLRQDFISARLKMFPFSERSKIIKSLPFELEEDVPFSSESAIYDARITQFIGPRAEVLAVTAPKNRIETALRRAKDGDLSLTLLSAEALSYSNCFEKWSAPPKSSPATAAMLAEEEEQVHRTLTARLDIGHTHTLVLAYEEDRLIGVRSILWGGKNVADAIARKYEMPYIEALTEMRKKAFILVSRAQASYDQIVFSDTIAEQVRTLAQEVRISLLEFQTELHGDFEQARITGGFSQTLNLQAYLTQVLEIPVNRAEFLHRFTTTFDRNKATEAVIGVSLGLALEGLRRPKNPPIQFLRAEYAKQKGGLQDLWQTWSPAIQATALVFAILFIYGSLRESFSLDLAGKAQEAFKKQAKDVAGLAPRQANEAGVRKYISDQRKHIRDARDIESAMKMNSALDIVKKISDAAPNRTQAAMTIRKFSVTDQRVQIEGVLINREHYKSLENAMKAVAKGPVQGSVGTPAAGRDQVSFAFSFEVDRGVGTSVR